MKTLMVSWSALLLLLSLPFAHARVGDMVGTLTVDGRANCLEVDYRKVAVPIALDPGTYCASIEQSPGIAYGQSAPYDRRRARNVLLDFDNTKVSALGISDGDVAPLSSGRPTAIGALARPEGDYLLVVDSNVGFNKVTASVAQRIDYTVTLDGDRPQARLVLTYENLSTARRPGCDQATQYSPVYADMTRGCYWDYVRVYAPPGARLVASSGGDEAAEALRQGTPSYRAAAKARGIISGRTDEVVETLGKLADLGLQEVQFQHFNFDDDSVPEYLAAEIAPRVKGL